MAFQAGIQGVMCKKCQTEGKFFQMFQSFRTEHAYYDDSGRIRAVLLCIKCEVQTRQEEWETWTPEQKEIAGDDYPLIETVKKEQKKRIQESASLNLCLISILIALLTLVSSVKARWATMGDKTHKKMRRMLKKSIILMGVAMFLMIFW